MDSEQSGSMQHAGKTGLLLALVGLGILLSSLAYQDWRNNRLTDNSHTQVLLDLLSHQAETLLATDQYRNVQQLLDQTGQADPSIVSLQLEWPGLEQTLAFQRNTPVDKTDQYESPLIVGSVHGRILLERTATASYSLQTQMFQYALLYVLIAAGCGVVFRRLNTTRRLINQLSLSSGVFTCAREGILITDPDGKILNVNQAFCQFTGYREAQLTGHPVDLLKSSRHSEDFYAQLVQQLFKQGHWNGEIWFQAKNGAYLAALVTINAVYDEQNNIQKFFAFCSDITKQMLHQRKLEQIAHYDTLTHLPNRILLSDRLHRSMLHVLRENQQLAIVFIDLDGFKAINDNYGHHTGDQVLLTLATRMTQSLRQGDTVSRLGGDEFVAVLSGLNTADDCLPLLQRMLDVISAPVHLDGQLLQVSGSLGVTFFPQPAVVDAEQLLLQADQAMYQAKLNGKNCFQIFSQLEEAATDATPQDAESRIKQGLTEGQFLLQYEPVVDLQTGEATAVEGHIRWQHPEKGLLAPGVFLTGLNPAPLYPSLDMWALSTGCAQLAAWWSQGVELDFHIKMHTSTFTRPGFLAELTDCLARYPRLPAGSVVLELQEPELLAHLQQLSPILSACSEQGVVLALDEFSTGDHSLAYLNTLPLDILKAERTFLRGILDDVEDLCMVHSTLDAAEAFQRDLIAADIETLSHGEQLIRLGFRLGQGYAVAEPMYASEVINWCRDWQLPASWHRACPVNDRDLPLLYSRPEQQQLLRRVEQYLQGNHPADFLMPEQCHLCQWLNRLQSEKSVPESYLNKADMLHRQRHQIIESLVHLTPENRQQALNALTELKEINLRLDNVIDDLLVKRGKQPLSELSLQ